MENWNMNRQSNRYHAIAFAAVIVSAGVLAQPVAQSPAFKAGDKWSFRSTETPGDKADQWSREIVEVQPDKLVVRFGNGKTFDYDTAMNFIDPKGPANSRVLAKYPLETGAKWSFTRKMGSADLDERGEAKVAGYESLTVPAGTFDCYRVDVEANYNNKQYTETRLWSRWYCPAIKWIAKERLETRTFNTRAPPSTTVVTSELVAFTPGS
jgi:hypothetical protein